MTHPKFIDIDGKRHLWRDLLQQRREQQAAAAKTQQLALFELKEDCRPTSERTASGRHDEPSLFTLLDREG